MLERMESYQAMVQEMYRVIDSRELLEKTLENLATQGWDQGQLVNGNGEVCLIGGLNLACVKQSTSANVSARYGPEPGLPQHDEYMAALELLRRALLDTPEARERLGDERMRQLRDDPNYILYAIPAFNDKKSTTYEDVTLLVKRAIEKSEESTEDE